MEQEEEEEEEGATVSRRWTCVSCASTSARPPGGPSVAAVSMVTLCRPTATPALQVKSRTLLHALSEESGFCTCSVWRVASVLLV